MTLEAVTSITNSFLESVRNGGEVTEEAAAGVVESLSAMMEVTAGGGSGKEVAAALVQGVELVGGALLDTKEVGAPPTEVVSAALQISVAKRDPALLDAAPFTVPASPSGRVSAAQVVMPQGVTNGLGLGVGEAVGTTLWSSTADNVHGVDMGLARGGSPTLAFSLSVNGIDLHIKELPTPIQLKLDVYNPIDPGSTCVGAPTGKVLFEGANNGHSPCTTIERCEYFDTVLQQYSTEGCDTAPHTAPQRQPRARQALQPCALKS